MAKEGSPAPRGRHACQASQTPDLLGSYSQGPTLRQTGNFCAAFIFNALRAAQDDGMASWVSFDIGFTWQRLGVLGIASGDAVGHPGGVLTSIPKNGWALGLREAS